MAGAVAEVSTGAVAEVETDGGGKIIIFVGFLCFCCVLSWRLAN